MYQCNKFVFIKKTKKQHKLESDSTGKILLGFLALEAKYSRVHAVVWCSVLKEYNTEHIAHRLRGIRGLAYDLKQNLQYTLFLQMEKVTNSQ